MESEVSIRLNNVVVEGVNTLARAKSIKQWVLSRQSIAGTVSIPILNGVSLEAKPGDRIGILGGNGSGKSSLLKVIAGIYPAKSGDIEVIGRVAPLIELGDLFDRDFTGRQNIKIGLTYAGRYSLYSKALEDEIIAFSGLGDKIDMAYKTFSSGMMARLAFAIAVFQRPDILLLDEALATGDEAFVRKSIALMEQQFDTIPITIQVSHTPELLTRLCNRCIWMENGQIKAQGSPNELLPAFLSSKREEAHA